MLKIIDLGTGNIGSVINAIKHLDFEYETISTPDELVGCTKIILPGVGNFSLAAKQIHSTGFSNAILKYVLNYKTPILGICVGMQLLARCGYEGGKSNGLGLIDAEVKQINNINGTLTLPHMGWNDVTFDKLPLFNDIEAESCFYFVHSYAMKLNNTDGLNVAYTDYGEPVVAYISKGNIHGAQFHPEKSQAAGLCFLENFITKC